MKNELAVAGVLMLGTSLMTFALVSAADTDPNVKEVYSSLIRIEDSLSEWIIKADNNICGMSTARTITNPARVRYQYLLNLTPSMKELKQKGIKIDSAQGQILVTKATSTLQEACKQVMTDKSYCSVWKKIAHKHNKQVPDISSLVKEVMTDNAIANL